MAKIDMHCHTFYSGRPSDWFLQRIGTRESYTLPEELYRKAKEKGMKFITITDHNTIEGAKILQSKYPDDVIIGCEWTTYFPEDGCKIHLLTYDITEKQFEEMDILRENIYKLRDYIKYNNIAHSVAHATYSINGKLTIEHLEKLILLFDNFETINGSRSKASNDVWQKVLLSLTPEIIENLKNKYGIEPFSDDPWIKGFTGGSDDHANLFIGDTYTITSTNVKTKEELVSMIKNKQIRSEGRHNDYKSFAFTLYKILYDFSKNKTEKISSSFLGEISALVFEKKELTFLNWLKSRQLKKKKKNKEEFKMHLFELIEGLKKINNDSFDEKFDFIFQKITDVIDDFLKMLSKNILKSVKKGDIYNIAKEISALIPVSFLSLPFFSTFAHMHSSAPLLESLKEKYLKNGSKEKKRILWFTDTIVDLNGVSVTIKNIGWLCHKSKRDLNIVCSLSEEEANNKELPPNIINLPYLVEFPLPNYETVILKIPSILKTIETLYKYEPDEIYISTPGFIGLIGLLFAKLTNTKTVGVYHTDFTEQARKIIGEDSMLIALENAIKFFYNQMDKIKVPSNEYIEKLTIRGFNRDKMYIFKRGIDELFMMSKNDYLGSNIDSHINTILVYSGRISQDKNLDFLIDTFNILTKKYSNLFLVIIGDGPYFNEFKKKNKENHKIIFTGRVNRKDIPQILSLSDIFVFPSTTDTFGMSVLEAQSCGLPAVVSDIGGPKEIVLHNKTGFVLPIDQKEWVDTISYLIDMKENNKKKFISMKISARENIINNYDWEVVLQEIFEENKKEKKEKNNSKRELVAGNA